MVKLAFVIFSLLLLMLVVNVESGLNLTLHYSCTKTASVISPTVGIFHVENVR